MKITKTQLEQIKKFSKEQVKKNDPYHRQEHIDQTVEWSKILAKKEKADTTKSIIIALLHDISKHKQSHKTDHGDHGAKTSKTFLKKLKLQDQDIDDICYAIQQHNKGGIKKTKEASIIWDADKLQGMGAYGMLRAYGYLLEKEKKSQEETLKKTLEEQVFFLKRFRTKTGKKIAKKYYKFTKKFQKEYIKQKNNKP